MAEQTEKAFQKQQIFQSAKARGMSSRWSRWERSKADLVLPFIDNSHSATMPVLTCPPTPRSALAYSLRSYDGMIGLDLINRRTKGQHQDEAMVQGCWTRIQDSCW